MLDKPEKTYQLLAALKAAVPFEVDLMPSLIAHLQAKQVAVAVNPRQIVSEISYAGEIPKGSYHRPLCQRAYQSWKLIFGFQKAKLHSRMAQTTFNTSGGPRCQTAQPNRRERCER